MAIHARRSDVERIDTHASIVFLAGARAYKLKRAVRFDYLDFSTSERRHALCQAEARLNRRTAPTLYRGVLAVTRQHNGWYAVGGTGTPVDWLVEMNRFPKRPCSIDWHRRAPLRDAHVATGGGHRRLSQVRRAPPRSRRQGGHVLGR